MNPILNQHLQKGKELYREKAFRPAYQQFSLAIGLIEDLSEKEALDEPARAELHVLRGNSLLSLNEEKALNDPEVFHEIMHDLDQAVDLMPDEVAYLHLRGRMYLLCGFEDYLENARMDFAEALRFDKEHLDSLKSMGELFLRKKDGPKAIYYMNLALEQVEEPDSFALRAMGHIYSPVPDHRAALFDFGKSLELDPSQEELYIWRAQCFQELGLHDDAIEAYDRLIDVQPNNAGYYVDRGVLRGEVNDQAAFEDYSQALQIAPHPLAYNNRADYFRRSGQYERAIEDAQEALKVDPESTIAYATLAEIYADMGNREGFYTYLKLSLEHYYEDHIDAMSEPAFAPYVDEENFQRLMQQFSK